MWPFRDRSTPDLIALTARLDNLESKFRTLSLEWTETFDKIQHALDRQRKRDSKANGQSIGTSDLVLDPISELTRRAREQGLI